MVLSSLSDNLGVQSLLILVALLSASFLKYLVFLSLIPIGCSRLTITLLSLTLGLITLLLGVNEHNLREISLEFKSWPSPMLWVRQGLLGIAAALPYLVVSCAINLIATIIEATVGGGFMSLFSPWFKTHSSSLRTMMDSWAICVVLLPSNFQLLVEEVFGKVAQPESYWNDQAATWIVNGSGLRSGVNELLIKLTETFSNFAPLLMIYVFLDFALVMVSKPLNKGMFQGELSQLKGVVTLLIFNEVSSHPHYFSRSLGR